MVLGVRTLSKGEAAIQNIRVNHPTADLELLWLDLASLDAVRAAAAELKGRLDKIDLLINNAGAMLRIWQTYSK